MFTDSYVVSPIFFSGGSIGELAVNGTVNDLAVSGAKPLMRSATFCWRRGWTWRRWQGGGGYARGDLAIDAPIESDTRAVNGLVEALLTAAPGTRWMRDATRGGVATVLNELARATGLGVAVNDDDVLVNDMMRGACDMLGVDPLYVANEGTFMAVVPSEEADAAVAALRALPGGEQADVIGRVVTQPAGAVVLVTGFGGTRMVDMLVGDPLPRIC